jgi:Glycosyl hydrolases family 18
MTVSRLRLLVAAGLALVPLLLLAAGAGSASTTAAAPLAPRAARVYAPYFETWSRNHIYRIARRSGAHHLTLAFIQTPRRGSCNPTWNGDPRRPTAAGGYSAGIAALRRAGGAVVPSFGGFSADHALTEIADSCTDTARLVAAYESVVRTYGVTRLDMDVEDRSLSHLTGIDRRNQALRIVERWAARTGRRLRIQYTLPAEPAGLEADGLHVVRNAIRNGTRVDVVNIMVFDYYDGTTTDMGAAAESAARGLHRQLHALYPGRSSRRLWAMEGLTLMPGIDDYPHKTEVTSLADATTVRQFAAAMGIGTLSIWAIQRDNGGCPGQLGSDTCSGIVQPEWAFSHLLEPFTRRGRR